MKPTSHLYFAASEIYTNNECGIIKNGIIETDKTGKIISVLSDKPLPKGAIMKKGIIVPGFINAHCHLELSYLHQKIPGGRGLLFFIQQIQKLRNKYEANVIIDAARQWDKKMYENGIVACIDISNDVYTLDIKQKSSIYYHTFLELFGLTAEAGQKMIKKLSDIAIMFERHRLPFGYTLHAPYSISQHLLEFYLSLRPSLLSIHNQETTEENEWFKTGRGKFGELYVKWNCKGPFTSPGYPSSLRALLPHLEGKVSKVLWVHNTFTSAEDIAAINRSSIDNYWCFCPNANLYIENTLPDFSLFPADKCVLGTDSLASNSDLSIWKEIQCIRQHTSLPLKALIKWSSLNASRLLNIENQYGSIEPGKKPGLVYIDNPDDPDSVPVRLI